MGIIKKHWLLSFNKLLSFILLLLGFTSCDEERKEMYGMPPARFSVKANVINEKNQPLEGIRVDIKTNDEANHILASGLTNSQGILEIKTEYDKVNIVCTDIRDPENATYEKDSVQTDISKSENLRYEFLITLKEKK